MEDKLIIVNPYYYFKNDREIFYKNGTVIEVIPTDSEKELDYFCVPKIPNQNSFENFKNYEEFSLPLVSKGLIGQPRYLFYDKKVYTTELESSSSNDDTYWKAKNNTIKELNIDYDPKISKNEIVDCSNGFIYYF